MVKENKLRIKVSKEEKERRKAIGLPVTKPLRYMKHNRNNTYTEISVLDYDIVQQYQPSGTYSLMITLETGEKIRILAPFFVQMQRPSFVKDMERYMRQETEEEE